MKKNIVICCDGTNNEFGANNSNVVRLVQVAKRDFDTQHVYYDPGIGTLPEPGVVTWMGRKLSEIAGLAFGTGIPWKVQEAYAYLMDWWEPGDDVYLFGFSRGAYTVRILAGLLYELGLLAHGADNMLPYAMRLYATAGRDRRNNLTREESDYWKLRDQFRESFARPVFANDDVRRFPIHFMGLWDTVASVGWAWDPPKFPFTTHNPGVTIIRHAVSVDERRWFFRPNLFDEPAESSDAMRQMWFAGVHSDVGGGYAATDGSSWRAPFEWMVEEAANNGMLIDQPRKSALLNSATPMAPQKANKLHESLHGVWWLAEFFPKLCRLKTGDGRRVVRPRLGLGRHRMIVPGRKIDKSTLMRIRDLECQYEPPNLSPEFLERVRGMGVVPEHLPYAP